VPREVDLDKEIILTEKERKQIELQREIGYGKITIHLEAGQPVRYIEALKSGRF